LERSPSGAILRGVSADDVEMVRRAYDAFNRRDLQTLIPLLHPDFELQQPPEIPGATNYRGPEGALQWLDDMNAVWGEIRAEPEQFIDTGEQVVVLGRMRNRGRASGAEVEAQRGWICRVEEGRLRLLRLYLDPGEAREVAGIGE
jgi:ketosteroid isomerase-like protein